MNCLKMVEVVELEDQYDNMTIDPSTCIVICKSFFLSFFAEFVIQLSTDAWGVIDL